MVEADTTLPALLDTDEEIYRSYGWNEDAFAPFPYQVLVDRRGVIRYVSRQYDAEALRFAIEEALTDL